MTSKIEKTDRVLSFATAATVAADLLRRFWVSEAGKEVTDKIIKKATGLVIGSNTKEAALSTDDETLFDEALDTLSDQEIEEVESFAEKLKEENEDQEAAFVLFVAQRVDKYAKKTTRTSPKSKDGDKPVESTAMVDYSEGALKGGKFIQKVLSKKGANADETFKLRVSYLKSKHAFDLIEEKKDPGLFSRTIDVSKRELTEGKKELDNQLNSLADWLDSKGKKK